MARGNPNRTTKLTAAESDSGIYGGAGYDKSGQVDAGGPPKEYAQKEAEDYLKRSGMYGYEKEGRYGTIEVGPKNDEIIETTEQTTYDVIDGIGDFEEKAGKSLNEAVKEYAKSQGQPDIMASVQTLVEKNANEMHKDPYNTSLAGAFSREEGKPRSEVPQNYVDDNIKSITGKAMNVLRAVVEAGEGKSVDNRTDSETLGYTVAKNVYRAVERNTEGFSEEYLKAVWSDTTSLVNRVLKELNK